MLFFRLQEDSEEVKEIHCNQDLPLNVANAFDLNFNSLKEYLLKQAFRLLRMRARAKMIFKGGACTTGCDERERCVGV